MGSYDISGVVSNGSGQLSNYTVVLTDGTLTVNKATLDYTILDDAQTYGTPADFATDLGTTIPTGIIGETLDITYSSTGDTSTAGVGAYDISAVVSNGTGLLSNYTVDLLDGILTVSPAPALPTPTVTVADAGGTYSSLAFPATGTVTGTSDANLGTPVLAYYPGTYTTVADLDGVTALSGMPVDARRVHGSGLLRRQLGLHGGQCGSRIHDQPGHGRLRDWQRRPDLRHRRPICPPP